LKVVRHTVQACCGKTSIIFKTDRPIMKEHLDKLVALGFTEAKHFTAAGILYVDNAELILKGPFGSDRLQVQCKVANCDEKVNDLEALLQQLE
jgi:hypothetical protein